MGRDYARGNAGAVAARRVVRDSASQIQANQIQQVRSNNSVFCKGYYVSPSRRASRTAAWGHAAVPEAAITEIRFVFLSFCYRSNILHNHLRPTIFLRRGICLRAPNFGLWGWCVWF